MFSDRLQAILPDLRAYARVLTGNTVLADDVVQNTCLRAWQNRSSFDPEKGPLRAWMFRILRNEYYQHMRGARLRRTEDDSQIDQRLIAACDLEPRSDLSRMLKAVHSLKEAQRDAFLLVVAAGFTYEEAGDVLGCAAGTVKSRVSRARNIALGRYHSEHWVAEEPDFVGSPIEQLHSDLNHIQAVSKAA
ncbi:MAG: sigma-70 family RNA polymerase sigma factor [Pseudomonadota bacterium]